MEPENTTEKNDPGEVPHKSQLSLLGVSAHLSSLGSVITVMKDVESSMASKYSVSSSSSLSSPLEVKRLPRDTYRATASVCSL